jgi:hypothetical protein
MTMNSPFTSEVTPESVMSVLSFRDALDRVTRVQTEAEAATLYSSALAGGDTDLMRALQLTATQKGWSLDAVPGAESKNARSLLVDLLNLAVASPGQISAGENFTDPRLTAAAVKEERTTQTASSIADINAKAKTLYNEIINLSNNAQSRADRVRPKLNPNDPTQLTRTAQAWEYNILPALSKGTTPNWGNILTGLDIDGLLAVQRFAPSWIKANTSDPGQVSDLTNQALAGVEAQLTDAVTDPAVRAVLINERDTNDYANQAQGIAYSLTNLRTARDASLAGMSVQNIAYRIGALGELQQPAQTTAPKYNRIG